MTTTTLNKKANKALGASLVALSSIFYASYGIWTTLLGDFFGGYTATAWRCLLVLLILVPLAIAYRQLEPIGWRRNWRYLIGLVLTAILIWGPLYYAILQAGVGMSLAVNYAAIVIGMFFFGWLFAGERFTKDKLISACLGLIGLALVFAPTIISGFGWLALGLAALSGLNSAAHYVIAKKLPYNATQSTISMWTASLVVNIPMALVLREPQPGISWHIEWLYLLIFALASVISTWTLMQGIKRIDAGVAGILGLLEVVFGVVFGVLLFHERPGLVVLAGVGVIIGAAAVPYVRLRYGRPQESTNRD